MYMRFDPPSTIMTSQVRWLWLNPFFFAWRVSGIILDMSSANDNERLRYNAALTLIGSAQTQNDPCGMVEDDHFTHWLRLCSHDIQSMPMFTKLLLDSLSPGRFQFNSRKAKFQAIFSEWWL